ncbi:hypothetical protein C7N43_03390 [Sphingobacteriales bacterium UPWRP_1]|nr:hypothetical protein BVG80_08795 [Sphingobacteriales bacterium TSM_CSM]PSJ78522.1 hypothetical protein C7N43_03390 [Sphingobacteriales bacterium UPWRP_1]
MSGVVAPLELVISLIFDVISGDDDWELGGGGVPSSLLVPLGRINTELIALGSFGLMSSVSVFSFLQDVQTNIMKQIK